MTSSRGRAWAAAMGAIATLALVTAFGCAPRLPTVPLEATGTAGSRGVTGTPAATSAAGAPELRVAVGGRITPREGLKYYRHLIEYVGRKLGRRTVYMDKEGYAEINEMLRTRELDLAFVCSGPYAKGHDEFGLELLVAPVAYGKRVYHSYLIVPRDSTARSLKDLRGKSFAFTDPDSNTGKLVPTFELTKMGEKPETFFSEITYSGAHDRSIRMVARKEVDGATVDSLIFHYMQAADRTSTADTLVVWRSPPFGIPPVVVPPGTDEATRDRMARVFLDAHRDPEGGRILRSIRIDRFERIADSAYDSIRRMDEWVSRQAQRKG